MRVFYLLTGLLLLSLLTPACVDEIPLPEPDAVSAPLVIQGRISKGAPSLIRVQLHLAASFAADDFPDRISGAQVQVLDRAGSALAVPEVEPGLYERQVEPGAAMAIETDRDYQLLVALPDGRRYRSDFETVRPVPRPDSLSYALVTRNEQNSAGNIVEIRKVQIFIHSSLRATGAAAPAALKWDFSGVWQLKETDIGLVTGARTCFIFEAVNLEEVLVADGRQYTTEYLDGRLLFEEPVDDRFSTDYYLTAVQHSLTPAAFEYWSRVGEVTNRSGGLFEKPPASIPGNIRNVDDPIEKVLGFFYAGETDTVRRRIELPLELVPAPECPPNASPGESQDLALECLNCLLWPRSSLQRPDYW